MSEVGFEGAVDGLGVEAFEACGEVVEVGAEVGESVQVAAGGVAVGVGEEGGVGGVCPGVEPFLVGGVVGGCGQLDVVQVRVAGQFTSVEQLRDMPLR